MKYSVRILVIALLFAPVTAWGSTQAGASAAQDTKAVKTMAGILLSLTHFPSDADKKTLQGIIDDKASTAQERTLATALMNVQHKASAADQPKLDAIMKDEKAPESIKTIASVLVGLNHTPTDAEKAKLKKLAGAE